MEQPEGFKVKGKEHMVYRMKKSLYGLKQAHRQRYKKFDSFMLSHGYQMIVTDSCVYFRRILDSSFIILLLYVDDMLIVGQNSQIISGLRKELFKSFDVKDLGSAQRILGMDIARDRKARKLWLSQEKYIERLLDRFNKKDASQSVLLLQWYQMNNLNIFEKIDDATTEKQAWNILEKSYHGGSLLCSPTKQTLSSQLAVVRSQKERSQALFSANSKCRSRDTKLPAVKSRVWFFGVRFLQNQVKKLCFQVFIKAYNFDTWADPIAKANKWYQSGVFLSTNQDLKR
ncbi:uncharacterized protein LOC109841966 [Asparagus officinalis]|uniref:uncharacterized protein LOC109841966 n=1 Tax=Asparagus officinalis TaxID=4686 RepID=UPI00098E0C2D|nr:uncharacterized protein LOC109841966 [Asparagus officinalis]